jgi:hypothetical protein
MRMTATLTAGAMAAGIMYHVALLIGLVTMLT